MSRLSSRLIALSAIGVVCFAANDAAAQLSNPSFDSPYSTGDLVPFAGSPVDQWGVENATVVPADVGLGISPFAGEQMLRMENDGSAETLAGQLVGIEHLAAEVDAGFVSARYFSYFNVPSAVSGATVDVYFEYYDAGASLITTSVVNSATLDSDVSTWEEVADVGIPVPAGTRRVKFVFGYDTAPLGQFPGFADRMTLIFDVVPEPTSGVMLACGLSAVAARRRR